MLTDTFDERQRPMNDGPASRQDHCENPVEEQAPTRRHLLHLAAGAATGATVAALAGTASPARAETAEFVQSGYTNAADNSTQFVYGTDLNSGPSGVTTSIVEIDTIDAPSDVVGLVVTGTGAPAIVATHTGALPAVDANSIDGAGLAAGGGAAAILLVPVTGTPPSQRVTPAVAGMIDFDANEDLWVCVIGGTPGTWRKIAGPTTSGSFHPINPARVYDSRLTVYSPGGGTPMARLTNRIISVKDGRDSTGVVTDADIVPVGATAVTLNITVASPSGPNYIAVAPGDAASTSASTINFSGTSDVANGATIKLDLERRLRLFAGDQAGSTHVIVDITGYYL